MSSILQSVFLFNWAARQKSFPKPKKRRAHHGTTAKLRHLQLINLVNQEFPVKMTTAADTSEQRDLMGQCPTGGPDAVIMRMLRQVL